MTVKRQRKRSQKKSTLPVVFRVVMTILAVVLIGGLTYVVLTSGRELSETRARNLIMLSFSQVGVPATDVKVVKSGQGVHVFESTLTSSQIDGFEKKLRKQLKRYDAKLSKVKAADHILFVLQYQNYLNQVVIREGTSPRASSREKVTSPQQVPESPMKTPLRKHVHLKGLPRVAIILDDVGLGHMGAFNKALSIPFPLTFSILPFRRYSRECAGLARGRGFEMMVHMPMEPYGYPKEDPGPGALFEKDSKELIEKKVQAAFDNVPYASGMNNHMGSKVTALPFTMRVLMQVLKRDGLFFIDSRTSPDTVAEAEALRAGVPTLNRDIFLDNERTTDAITKQLLEAVKKAKEKGYVVAIGHNCPETISVLASELPKLDREVNFVFIKELVNEAGRAD